MANNPWYNYDSAFIAGTLGRAEAVAAEFTLVQTGFSLLTVQGTDSGAANAYVVTITGGGPSGAYADGQCVEFKALHANTGACTINVNGLGVVGLTTYNGQNLAAAAIVANTWYLIRYNSTYSAFTLLSPTALITTSNTIASTAPTNKVGLTAAGGVSLACTPIDATYAIDQSIVPTWTGAHTFSGGATFSAAPTFSAGLGTITGPASTYAAILNGNSGVGVSYGVKIDAGTNASDIAFLVNSQAGTAYLEVLGEGSVTVGSPTGGAKGVGTINAVNLYVNGVAVLTASAVGANPTGTVGLTAVNGSATTFLRSDGAPPLSQAIAPTWTAAHTFTPGSAVTAVSINCAINAIGLVVTGATNTSLQWVAQFFSGQGSGFSDGVLVQAGTTSGDYSFAVNNAAGNSTYFAVYGDGEVMLAAPTTAPNQGTNFYQVGYLDTPPGTASGTLVFRDRGKMCIATGNITIPANGSVPYPIGTTIMVYNNHGSSITIGITTDTLTWVPSAGSGTRTLAASSVATLFKLTATSWLIWGFGLT